MLSSWWNVCWDTVSQENVIIFAIIGWEIFTFPFFIILGALHAIFGGDR